MMRKVGALVVLLAGVVGLSIGCRAIVAYGLGLSARATTLASSIRVVTSWGATAGAADSIVLTHFVGQYPGRPDSVRHAYPSGPARSDTVVFAPPTGYSVTGWVYARLKRAATTGPADSVAWAATLPLTAHVPAFAVRVDTLP